MPFKFLFCQLLFCVLFGQQLASQNYTLKNFTQKDGLSSNEVYDVIQDKNGFMWFATDRGLTHYNGNEFKRFEPKDGLTDITIFDFFKQDNGQIWCITLNNKLFYIQDGTEKFIPYKYNAVIERFVKERRLTAFFIANLAVDHNNTLHLFMTNGHYITIDAKGRLVIEADVDAKKRPSERLGKFFRSKKINRHQEINYFTNTPTAFLRTGEMRAIRRILSFGNDYMVVMTDGSVFIQNRQGAITTITYPNFEPIEGGIYDEHHFWIGYRGKGMYVYDYKGTLKKKYLEKHSVTKIYEDSFGGLWFSTIDSGVFFLKKEQINSNLLKGIYVNSLTKDNDGNLYTGCFNGDIYKISAKGDLARVHTGLVNKPAIVQFNPAENQVYYATDNVLFTSFGNRLEYCGVLKVSDDTKKIIASRFGVYNVFENEKELFADTLNVRIQDISEVNGKYYIATLKGLKIVDKGRLVDKKGKLADYRIDDVDYEPGKQLFYLASMGAGVLVYNPKTEKVITIDKSDGLSNNLVTEVYIEDKNTIWACTNYGLNRIRFQENGSYTIQYLTAADGLPENQIRDVEIIDEVIHIATTNGLCSLSKADFEQIFSKRNYFLRLKTIAINAVKQVTPQKLLDLSYNENQLDFWIESVSFKNKEQVYRYKLKGLHDKWNYTKDRKVSYEFLPPGDYEFIVQILEDNRLFSDEKIILPIHISEPFWKRSWFICLVIFLTAALIYAFFKIRILTYNQDIIRELLRLWVRKIKKKEKYFTFREQGKEIRIKTDTILYVKSSGNYIDVITRERSYTIRCKIGEFITKVPDPLEFLRVHRSYIVRIDQVAQKNKKAVFVNQQEIPVGETYLDELDKIVF